jgi:hypothetical protein
MQPLYIYRFVSVLLMIFVIQQGSAQSNDHRLDAYVVRNGPDRIAHDKGYTMLMGSSMYETGKYSGNGIAIDAATGIYDAALPVISGNVAAVVSDGQGGWYIGGSLTAVDNEPVENLIHIKADKTLDASFNPAPNAYVRTLVLEGTTLYMAGNFSQVSGQNRNYIAAIDISTNTLLPWNPNANSFVHAIQVVGTTVYVGGEFSSIGGKSLNNLAALNSTTGAATSWVPPVVDNDIYTLAVNSATNTIYIGGIFDAVGGLTRTGLAAINIGTTTGTVISTWVANTNGTGYIYKVTLSGSSLFVAGYFTTINGVARNSVAAVSTTNGGVTTWNANLGSFSTVNTLALSGTTLYIGGYINQVNLTDRFGIAAVTVNTGALLSWNPNLNSDVTAVAVNGNTVFTGGYFTIAKPQTTGNAIIFNETTGEIWPYTIELNSGGEIYTMAIQSNIVYIGGSFSTVNGSSRKNLAAFNLSTGALLSWAPVATGTTATFDNTAVRSMKIKDNQLYIGGLFLNVNGSTRPNLAAIDLTTGTLTAWNPVVGDGKTTIQFVNTLDISGSTVYIGGMFNLINGIARTHLAAVDATTGIPAAWAPEVNGSGITKLIVKNSTVYVLGDFPKSIGGAYRPYGIAALDATSGLATTWNPVFVNGTVNDMAVNNRDIYVAGYFDEVSGAGRNGMASFNLTTTTINDWNPDIIEDEGGFYVYTLAASDIRLSVGGGFYTVGNEARGNYAEYELCNAVGAVVLNGSTLTAPVGESYQWYLNNEVINGATSQTLDISLLENGVYAVDVSDNGCTGRSADFVYLITGNESTSASNIILYPNPASSEIIVKFSEAQLSSIALLDVMGQTIRSIQGMETENHIGLNGLPEGTYLVKIRYNNTEVVRKIVKIN